MSNPAPASFRFFTGLLFLLVLCPSGWGQTVQLIPDISIAEGEYRDATEAWLRNDPDLTKDLYKRDPDEMRKRIHRAAALSDDLMTKKQTYLQLVIERLEETRKRFDGGNQNTIPAPALKADLKSQQDRVLDDQQRVESQLRDLPDRDEYLFIRHALTEERASLMALQNDIALRMRSMDMIGKAQDAIKSLPPSSIAQELDGVLKIWEEEQAATISQRAHWTGLYRAMEKSLDQKDPSPKSGAKPARKPKAKIEQTGTSPIARAVSTGTPGEQSGLAGRWFYRSRPRAWSGYGEPLAVTLELYQEDSQWIGTYTARLPVRSAVHDIRLSLAGERRSGQVATLRWRSVRPDAEGAMEIWLSGDGRLLVERTESDDSYIPHGSEVLLR